MSYKARRVSVAEAQPFAWEPVGTRSVQNPPSNAPGQAPRPSGDPGNQAAAIERDAFARGFAQGERAGAEAGSTRVEGMLRRLSDTIQELAALRSELIRRTERQTVQLVLAIAERVTHREVTLDRSLLLGMARVALERLGEYGTATIRLHPDDFHAIGGKPAIDGATVQVVADASVNRGGCHVQSDFGFMDVSPESQFRELARALLSESDGPIGEADANHGIVLK